MKLYLVRHTKVDYPKGICYGQTDVGVMPTFDDESEVIKKQLKGISFSHVFVSPLTRCQKLAQVICPKENKILLDPRLMEINFGSWEGLAWDDIEITAIAQLWFQDFLNVMPPAGESFQQVINRVQDFLLDLSKLAAENPVLIVCHSGSIRAFYSIIQKISPQSAFDLKLDYGQICIFDYQP